MEKLNHEILDEIEIESGDLKDISEGFRAFFSFVARFAIIVGPMFIMDLVDLIENLTEWGDIFARIGIAIVFWLLFPLYLFAFSERNKQRYFLTYTIRSRRFLLQAILISIVYIPIYTTIILVGFFDFKLF